MRSNSLTLPILEILQGLDSPLSEYELITALKQRLVELPETTGDSQLDLFQLHFVVMNALYSLQQSLAEQGARLIISPLKIQLLRQANTDENLPPDTSEISDLSHDDSQLAAYYLDWTNFESTDEAAVEQLLNAFWQRYLASDKQLDAYEVLGVTPDSDWQQVQQQYRQLAAASHPDRGGNAEQFMAVREAYEVLRLAAGR